MAVLSWEQTVKDAWEAGFRSVDLAVISAIAYAESRLNTHPTGNPTHYGILQFDTPTAKSAGYSTADVLDPVKAFKAAYNLVYGSAATKTPKRGFQPWQTYTNGAYKSYLPHAQQAIVTSGVQLGGGPSNDKNPLTDINPANWGKEVSSSLTSGLNNIGPNISNALMDAGRSLLPYLVILVVLLFGAVLVYSGVVKQEARAVTGGLTSGG